MLRGVGHVKEKKQNNKNKETKTKTKHWSDKHAAKSYTFEYTILNLDGYKLLYLHFSQINQQGVSDIVQV